jgi:hypothetical protein
MAVACNIDTPCDPLRMSKQGKVMQGNARDQTSYHVGKVLKQYHVKLLLVTSIF